MTAYASIFLPGQAALPHSFTGCPAMLGINVNQYLGAYLHQAHDAAASFVDIEEASPFDAIGYSRAREAKRMAYMHRFAKHTRDTGGAVRSVTTFPPGHRFGIYTDVPIGRDWQYDAGAEDKYLADNERFAKLDPFAPYDFLGVHLYWHKDDRGNISSDLAHRVGRAKLRNAAVYGKPLVVFVMPVYDGSLIDLGDTLLAATVDAAGEHDKCLWMQCPTMERAEREAKRFVNLTV